MTQTAVVEQRLPGGLAQVRVLQKSACGHDCAECGSVCGMQRIHRLRAKNPLDAVPGDTVTLETGTKRVLGAAALAYLLPLATLLLGVLAALLLRMGEAGQAVCGLLGLGAGCALAAAADRRIRRHRPLEYTIIALERREET